MCNNTRLSQLLFIMAFIYFWGCANHLSLMVIDADTKEGLDDVSRELMRCWLRGLVSKGHGVLVATHDKEVIRCADRVITIQDCTLYESPGESSGEPASMPATSPSRDPTASATSGDGVVIWSIS